jgi:hypothetical protein
MLLNGQVYEMKEVYGINEIGDDGGNENSECLICMSEVKNTILMPCNHLCVCLDCAKQLIVKSAKCPICRERITKVLPVKVNK